MDSNDAWQEVDDEFETSNYYVRLRDDGDQAEFVVRTAPKLRRLAWDGARYVPYLDAHCGRPTMRCAFGVVSYPSGAAKVIEVPLPVTRRLKELSNTRPLARWTFVLRRRGAAHDMNTRYELLAGRMLSPDEQRRFAAVALLDVDNPSGRETLESAVAALTVGPPVTDAVAHELIEMLRALAGGDAARRFREHFRIASVGNLPEGREAEAREWIRCEAVDNANFSV